jgi:hypothetical protein
MRILHACDRDSVGLREYGTLADTQGTVTINTSALANSGNGPFTLDLQFIEGDGGGTPTTWSRSPTFRSAEGQLYAGRLQHRRA